MEVQIFGIKKSAETRKALRFFAERRIKTHFVDLHERPASLGELRRFVQRFGVSALVDSGSRRFVELNVTHIDPKGGWPIVWDRAKGVHVWDAEGNGTWT